MIKLDEQIPSTAETILENLDAYAKWLREQLSLVEQKRNQLLAQTQITCETNVAYGAGCGHTYAIGEIDYIQTHRYCWSDREWNDSEGQWKCPHCGHINRLYDKPEIDKLKRLFRTVIDHYKN